MLQFFQKKLPCVGKRFALFFLALFFSVWFASPPVFAGGREALSFFDSPAGRAVLFAEAQKLYDAKESPARAEEIVSRLLAAADEEEGVSIVVQGKDSLNAYALPGRIIVLNVPALSLPEGELAALLAHELGHIVHGDPAAILQKSPRAMSALSGVRACSDGSYDEHAAKKVLRAVRYSALTQKEERAADDFAAALLPKAGFSLKDARALLDRMKDAYGAVSSANSHLSWDERRTIFRDIVPAEDAFREAAHTDAANGYKKSSI